jgi:membrane protein
VLLATGVLGFWLRGPSPFETVAGYLRSFLPPALSEPLLGLVFELQKASSTLTVVGSLALGLAAVSLLATLRYVVGQAMGPDRHTPRSIHRGYLFDLRMTLQVGLLFLLSFGLTFAVNVLSVHSLVWAGRAGFDPTLVERGWRVVLRLLALLVPYLLSVGMFTQLFYFVPRPPPPIRSAFVGATVTAALFEAAKNAFTYYARYVGDFDRYSSGPGDTLGGVFGLIIGFVFWVYLSGLVLVIGTMVVALHEARYSPRRRTAARWLTRRVRQKHHEPAPVAEQEAGA